MASTIRDVATYAGVSLGTISKYINGGKVKEKTRQKIKDTIQELKFEPNNIAKGLRNAKTFTVGVLMPTMNSSFYSIIISALEEYLFPLGYSVIVSECHGNEEMEIEKVKYLLRRMVDGIVIMPCSVTGKQIEVIKENKTPFVVLDQILRQHKIDSVVLDNVTAIEESVEVLIKMKHRNIAIITSTKAVHTTAKDRLAGYEKAMNRHRIPLKKEYIRNGSYSYEGGYNAVMELFRLKKPATALVVCNDEMTIGAVLAIYFLRKNIPDDISLIGFDDLPPINVVNPPLSIISQPMIEMGRSAGRLLFRRINGDYSGYPERIVHKANLKLTESIRPLQKKK